MRLMKILVGIIFLLLLAQGLVYINLKVSEKYETQPYGLVEVTPEVQENVQERVAEINKGKRNAMVRALFLLIILIGLIVVYDKANLKNKKRF